MIQPILDWNSRSIAACHAHVHGSFPQPLWSGSVELASLDVRDYHRLNLPFP